MPVAMSIRRPMLTTATAMSLHSRGRCHTASATARPSIDLPRVLSCWTLQDARSIAKSLKPGANVLQMGAGFIGCIIMEALAAKGKLTVVEMGDRVVPRMMTPAASAMIERWCAAKGVEILTSTRVTAIETADSEGPMTVRLSDGAEREFDVVICATGVKPAVDYLDGSGIEIGPDGGIVVDLGMRRRPLVMEARHGRQGRRPRSR
jgi:NADPH-dependent 2,4-dienoyl-CoA reductase/sulfur reductase-like enzyme